MADKPRNGWNARHDRWAKKGGRESWAAWIAEIEERQGRKICGRGNSRKEPCGQAAGAGTGHLGDGPCKRHGGNTPVGIDSPHYKHGRDIESPYVKLPEELAERFHRLVNDPEILSLTREIALVRGRMEEVLEQSKDTVPVAMSAPLGKALKFLRPSIDAVRAAKAAEETEDRAREVKKAGTQLLRLLPVLEALLEIVTSGKDIADRWNEFYTAADTLRRLTEAHQKVQDREFGDVKPGDLLIVMDELRKLQEEMLRGLKAGEIDLDHASTWLHHRYASLFGNPAEA